MQRVSRHILAVNAGSSSIKFALFEVNGLLTRILQGGIDRIGLSGSALQVKGLSQADTFSRPLEAPDHPAAVAALMDWIVERTDDAPLAAVGHRVVHGGPKYRAPQLVTDELLVDLRQLTRFDPDHLPQEILLTEALYRRFPSVPQVVSFDTAFHRDLPRVARQLAIPRRYEAKGLQRYGFHGLSYAYLMEELARLGDRTSTSGRAILAHLGSGASMAAVRNGTSIDTSMGLTPTSGLVMSTRAGDLDPGLAYYLARTEQMTAAAFQHMVNHESGLLGVSEISSDMRDLLAKESVDVRAAEAIALFCYQAKKWIGSFAAALGGVDTLVFTGGIGENTPVVRARICEGLGFLGISLEESRNAKSAGVISPDDASVTVRVIRTDEELMIARGAMQLCTATMSNEARTEL